MSVDQLNQRQQEIAARQAATTKARAAAANASTQRRDEDEPGERPTRHWWLHPRDFADGPN